MQFIQDKLNGQGQVGYVYTQSNLPGVTFRIHYTISNALADPAACTLRASITSFTEIDPDHGTTYSEGGVTVTGDDLRRRSDNTIRFISRMWKRSQLKTSRIFRIAPLPKMRTRKSPLCSHPRFSDFHSLDRNPAFPFIIRLPKATRRRRPKISPVIILAIPSATKILPTV